MNRKWWIVWACGWPFNIAAYIVPVHPTWVWLALDVIAVLLFTAFWWAGVYRRWNYRAWVKYQTYKARR